jgi:hypothetical protein
MRFSLDNVLLTAFFITSAHAFSSPSMRNNNIRFSTELASEKDINSQGMVLKDTFDMDRASLLESAFDALNDKDKYDAVLTGLCSKILDGKVTVDPEQIGKEATLSPSGLALEKLKDPIRLVAEMNQRRVKASSRSLMALIDVSMNLGSGETTVVVTLVSSCPRNSHDIFSILIGGRIDSRCKGNVNSFIPCIKKRPALVLWLTTVKYNTITLFTKRICTSN